MKRLFLYIIFLSSLSLQAQNLVLNPSFEDYIACPTTFNELPFPSSTATSITDWSRPTESTSDYFNSCATNFFSVPSNFSGGQSARTGNAYTGIIISFIPDMDYEYREYIQTHLSSPLIAGHHYYAAYWISRAGNNSFSQFDGIDKMGIYFGVNAVERIGNYNSLDDLIPQIETPSNVMFTDTINWVKVSGNFTALGNEEWAILGSFAPESDLTYTTEPFFNSCSLYYYIDDVCIVDIDGPPGTYQVHEKKLCNGEELLLSATNDAPNYLWDDGSTAKDRTVTQRGIYWVKSVDTINCSVYADTFKINGIDTVAINVGNDTVVCPNIPLTLIATDERFDHYRWNTGSEKSFISITSAGKYYVTATSDCLVGRDTVFVTTAPPPKASLPQDITLCEGTLVSLHNDQASVTNSWSTGEQGCCIEVNKAGTYSLTVSNTCGEKASDEIKITYSGCNNCILAPTAFSPNNDGLNDRYKVISNCMTKSYALKIYNRWGQLVFQSYNPDESWDGDINGTPAESGVYFYKLKAVPLLDDIKTTEQKGDITLIR